METNMLIMWIVIYVVITVFVVVFALTYKWFIFGWKLFFSEFRQGEGLHFIRNASGNIGVPYIIDLNQKTHDIGDKQYVIDQSQLKGSRFFGKPFLIHDFDDTMTTAGLYFHQNNKKTGKPDYYEDDEGNEQPILKFIKPSVALPPDVFKAITSSKALTMAITDLFKKHKTQIYLLVGIAVGIGISAYFSYEMYDVKLPEIFTQLKSINTNIDILIKACEIQ